MSGLRFLVVVSLAASLLMIGVGMIVALLPQRVLELSGSLGSVGYVASAFALSYLAAQLPVGHLADRLGAKPFLIAGYALCCASGLIFAGADSPEAIFLGRFVQGAGEAPIWALGPALLSLAYPRARGRAIGIYNASIHIGLTAGPLLGAFLFPSGTGAMPFLLFAASCLAGGGTIVLFLPRSPSPSTAAGGRRSSLRDLAGLLRLRGIAITLAGVALYGAAYGVFVSVLPASLVVEKGFDDLSIGAFFALFYAAVGTAQLVVGPLSDRRGRTRYMIAGFLMTATGLSLFLPVPLPWTYVPLALASLGLGVFCVSSLAYLGDRVAESRKAAAAGSYYLSWGLGYCVGPLVVGQVGEAVGPAAGYGLLAVLVAAHAAALWAAQVPGGPRDRGRHAAGSGR